MDFILLYQTSTFDKPMFEILKIWYFPDSHFFSNAVILKRFNFL